MSSLKQVINYLTIPVGQELQSGLTAQDFSRGCRKAVGWAVKSCLEQLCFKAESSDCGHAMAPASCCIKTWFSSHFLFICCLSVPMICSLASSTVTDERDRGVSKIEPAVIYNLILEVIYHHFLHILFIRYESHPALIAGQR